MNTTETTSKATSALDPRPYIRILGTRYDISFVSPPDKRLGECMGCMDHTTKEIILKLAKEGDFNVGNILDSYMKTLRHEIIHAFLYESGLFVNSNLFEEGWAMNEEMIDFFAIQYDKIQGAIMEGTAVIHKLLEEIANEKEHENSKRT